jgi:integrase/recombinase XerD
MILLAPFLQSFFTEHLLDQRRASPQTVAAYRDAFRLAITFASKMTGRQPAKLALDDLDAARVIAFLRYLETERRNCARTRNARLSAIHSFFRYVATREPAALATAQQVLAIPHKRFERKLVAFLDRPEIAALLAAPDRSNWLGARDHALLLLAVETGLRVSELIGLTRGDVHLGRGAHVRCTGKGRKERCTPLRSQTVVVLRGWLKRQRGDAASPLFPSQRGAPLSRDAVERLLAKHTAEAAEVCPTLRGKTISPHVLRHTSAMQLLQGGVDRSTIALWLGHETVETTQMYLQADLTIKQRAIARTAPPLTGARRYRPPDALLAFLEAL